MPGSAFDANMAVLYGRFVQAAYTMYGNSPAALTPPPSNDFPAGYQLTAWIQMQDFVLESLNPTFYGFVAHSISNPNQLILAIRGTSNGIEWWDDANAVVLTPFKVPNCGAVGAGFARIYDTLELVERPTQGSISPPQSLKAAGSFAAQIATLLERRAAAAPSGEPSAASSSVEVTGHSLGAALATLYVMENAHTHQVSNPALCTFASPFVGDGTFAQVFNGLQLTSWRIVNEQDIVPKLPPEVLGFCHIQTEQLYSSLGRVQSSFSCWHALATYLSLIDPSLQPDARCQLTPDLSRAASLRAATRQSQ
ncbi:MAG: lipase family protein [Steroidobacteraceae bacterium]